VCPGIAGVEAHKEIQAAVLHLRRANAKKMALELNARMDLDHVRCFFPSWDSARISLLLAFVDTR
jgi:hypothetical protein